MNSHSSFDHSFHPRQDGEIAARALPSSRKFTSESLFHGGKEIEIDHCGMIYRLKITRQGKLILNK